MMMSEDMVKELGVKPLARLITYKVIGLSSYNGSGSTLCHS